MRVFAGLVDKISDISGVQCTMAPFLVGCEIYTKCYQYIHLPIDTKFSTRHIGCQLESDEIPDSKNTHQQHAAAIQARALDAALRSMVEDMKTTL